MWRYLFDSEFLQRADIEGAKTRLDHLARGAVRDRSRARERLRALEEQVGVLALAVRTTMRLLVEKGVATRAEIVAALAAVDAQDGAADGRWSGPVEP